jgi:ribonuclease BN (tRNA processing enzyme)
VRLTILGGCGGRPTADLACSGYLVEHDGFRVLVDPGYATLTPLLRSAGAEGVDAVLVSHGHPDHCADLHGLLRARHLRDDPAPALTLHAPAGALDRVLALDRPGVIDDAYALFEFEPGATLSIGPFSVETVALPHFVPNAGLRIAAAGAVLAYTGDTGPSGDLVRLADGADVFLAEASYPQTAPPDVEAYLSSAVLAARTAASARVERLVLTHLMPETDVRAAEAAARTLFDGPISVARPGLVVVA